MPLAIYGPYEIEASVDRQAPEGYVYVERPEPEEDADYYSVYKRYTDQRVFWIADFADFDDAVLFAREKHK